MSYVNLMFMNISIFQNYTNSHTTPGQSHYFGSTDGFNTELPEQLYINFAKEAYRASNKCNYEEQMAFAQFLSQMAYSEDSGSDSDLENLQFESCTGIIAATKQHIVHVLVKTPAHPQQSIQQLITTHGAVMFLPALKLFLDKYMLGNNIVDESSWQWHIRATPEVPPGPGWKPGSPSRFDMALKSNSV
ncbi:hypothetical protein BDR03DRAFT_1019535 [Suillus americanus]|nr:hypothetical protein BDR03DRAFT_1019535 [Suillus americanus]